MQQQRLFGEMPTFTFNGAIAGPTIPEGGSASIQCITDCVFSVLTFRYIMPTAVSLATLTIPAGTTLYGVSAYTVTSGQGQAFHSTV